MMTEVATVSIVAKNKYSGKAGGLPHQRRLIDNAKAGQETGVSIPMIADELRTMLRYYEVFPTKTPEELESLVQSIAHKYGTARDAEF